MEEGAGESRDYWWGEKNWVIILCVNAKHNIHRSRSQKGSDLRCSEFGRSLCFTLVQIYFLALWILQRTSACRYETSVHWAPAAAFGRLRSVCGIMLLYSDITLWRFIHRAVQVTSCGTWDPYPTCLMIWDICVSNTVWMLSIDFSYINIYLSIYI